MSWTTPRTWTAGELVTGGQLNTHVRDNLNALRTFPQLATSVTGAQNDYAPGLDGHTTELWSGASDASFTGLAGGVAGQRYTFKNVGTKIATFTHQSASSAAGNKFKNFVTSAPTPVAPGGAATWEYDGTDWQVVAHEQGAWLTVPFVSGDFTGSSSMTWTVASGNIAAYRYRLNGKTLTVDYDIGRCTLGGTASGTLLMKIPGGFVAAGLHRVPFAFVNGDNTTGMGLCFAQAGSNLLSLMLNRNLTGSWTLGANSIMTGQIAFEVN